MAYINSLAPYEIPSDYFDHGDEPFNGMFENGDPVPAGQVIGTPAGSREAEISNSLVEDVGNGGIREQLAQQLLAFIFNTYFRAGGLDAKVALPGEGDVKASKIIEDAVQAWSSGSNTARLLCRICWIASTVVEPYRAPLSLRDLANMYRCVNK